MRSRSPFPSTTTTRPAASRYGYTPAKRLPPASGRVARGRAVDGSSRMTIGARVAIEVHSASGSPSRPTSVVGQAAPSSWKCALTVPDGPRYGVLSDDAVSPCIVAVPTGPAAGFAGAGGPNACAGAAMSSSARLVAKAVAASIVHNLDRIA